MATLVAFASLPFGLQAGAYSVRVAEETVMVHVSPSTFTPFLTVAARPELAQSIPAGGLGEGFTAYTWYDHPFVLRVAFGRHVAGLGSINSCATFLTPLPEGLPWQDEAALLPVRERSTALALEAFNHLIASVRRKARLYHIFDLRREDIDVTVRREDGQLLLDDPLQATLSEEEIQHVERFDLSGQGPAWYAELAEELRQEEPISLAEELLMEAERALAQRFPRQALATCHIAIEIAASALITRGMARRGMPRAEIDHLLATKSLTSKLDVLLQAYTGFSLKRHNPALWKAFNQLNDLRNAAVHHGQPATPAHAQFALGVARELMGWLEMVRQRNKA